MKADDFIFSYFVDLSRDGSWGNKNKCICNTNGTLMTDQIRACLISDLQVLFSPGYSLCEIWLKGTFLFFFVWFIFKALVSLGSRASIPCDSPLAWSDK